jgi:hypothetical protein
MKTEPPALPLRRETDLIVRPLSDETLVYDLARDTAHCLNATAAAVWCRCDGRTGVSELAAALRLECRITADEDVVWLALRQLQKARLLQARVPHPAVAHRSSRRDLIRKLGTAAALPIVMTILAPTARAQASDQCTGMDGVQRPCSENPCPAGFMCMQVGPDMACGCVAN